MVGYCNPSLEEDGSGSLSPCWLAKLALTESSRVTKRLYLQRIRWKGDGGRYTDVNFRPSCASAPHAHMHAYMHPSTHPWPRKKGWSYSRGTLVTFLIAAAVNTDLANHLSSEHTHVAPDSAKSSLWVTGLHPTDTSRLGLA